MVFFRGKYQWNDAVTFFCAFSVNKSVGNNIFVLPTDLLMNKKLPMKDSSTEHFRL
jgi:hypothetical protein